MRVQMETTWGSTRRGDVLVGQGEDGGNALLRGWVDDRTWLLRHRVTGEFREAATGETLRRRPR